MFIYVYLLGLQVHTMQVYTSHKRHLYSTMYNPGWFLGSAKKM